MNAGILGIDPLDVSTESSARNAIDKVKNANYSISEHRANLGAEQNRLEHSYRINLNVAENTTAAESAIRDTDMAAEMVKLTKNNILMQAAQSMLSQANQQPQGVLQLLG